MAEELKQLFSNDKADELIQAITDIQKVDKQQGVANAGKALVVGADGLVVPNGSSITDEIKLALLACFQNVAWTTESGKVLYDDLRDALYASGSLDPDEEEDWDDDYTWLYRPHVDGLLSLYGNVSEAKGLGDYRDIENIKSGLLNLKSVGNDSTTTGLVFELIPQTANTGTLKLKVRFNEFAEINSPGNGFRCQVSNGSGGAQVYIGTSNGVGQIGVFQNGVASVINDVILETNKWYIIGIELTATQQIITVDGTPYTFSALSSYACTKTRVLEVTPVSESMDTDIAWITYKE